MRWIVLLAACLLAGPALAQGVTALQLQPGDLLFVTASRTASGGAIDDATARAGQVSYDHVAWWPAAASRRRCCMPTNTVRARSRWRCSCREAGEKQRQVDACSTRCRPAGDCRWPGPGQRLLGKPYNATYVPDEDSLYCSDFIDVPSVPASSPCSR